VPRIPFSSARNRLIPVPNYSSGTLPIWAFSPGVFRERKYTENLWFFFSYAKQRKISKLYFREKRGVLSTFLRRDDMPDDKQGVFLFRACSRSKAPVKCNLK